MYIAETNSTNTLLREQYLDEMNLFTIRTDFQTGGRGQQGNSWESERGQNLLFSTLVRDTGWSIQQQFNLSMAVALSLLYTIHTIVDEKGDQRLAIKWPNDLYYGDKKLAGILIENFPQGNQLARSIVGIGLNVNQTTFISDAPNPISIKQITGRSTNVEKILDLFLQYLKSTLVAPDLAVRYRSVLYRSQGFYPYEDADGLLEGEIVGISELGELLLRTREGEIKTYHFKQIKYIL